MGVIGAFVGVGLNFFDMGVGVGVLSCIFENPFCDQFLGLGVSFGVNLAHWSSIGCSAGGGLPMQSPPNSTRRTMAVHPWFVDPELAHGGGLKIPHHTLPDKLPRLNNHQKVHFGAHFWLPTRNKSISIVISHRGIFWFG